MGLILNLETATTNCSVSLARNGEIILLKELNSANYSHAEKLHVFIDEVIQSTGTKMQDLDAIAVSKGPGSYTGLRIGVSAAKGLCFALGVPLISVDTLQSMAAQLSLESKESILIPVLDARRMEVYSAVFNTKLDRIRETKAEIIDPDSFSEFLESKSVHFLGSGAEKIQSILTGNNIEYHLNVVPSAKEMALLSFNNYQLNEFEDVAYFEPFYLKDFVLQTKKN